MRQVGNDVLRVDDFNVVRCLDVGRSDRAFAVFAQAQSHFVAVVQFEDHALEVQQNVDDIFLHAINGGVLVNNTSDGDFSGGITDHGRQQDTAQRIAQRVAIATLEGLQSDLGAVRAELFNLDSFRFQQIGLHSDFLSIPPVRYTGKADEAPKPRCIAVREQLKQDGISVNTIQRSKIR